MREFSKPSGNRFLISGSTKKADVQALLGPMYKESSTDEVSNYVDSENTYTVLELFAGAGGLAIGLEKAGLKCATLNEIDKWACATLKKNRPNWNVLEGDIKNLSFTNYKGKDLRRNDLYFR